MGNMAQTAKGRIQFFILAAASFLTCFPVLLMAGASFMPEDELAWRYLSPLGMGKAPVRASMLPAYPSLEALIELLLRSPGFFVMFWNSCIQVFPMLFGQFLIGAPAAWALARFSFPGKRVLSCLYLLLLVLPFQVVQVSNYLVSTFPVYIMARSFEAVPRSLLEAAYLDGAGEAETFFFIGLPIGYPGMVTALVFGFMDGWNALEQPMAYLRDLRLWPLSLYLPDIVQDKAAVAFAAGLIMMAPPVLLYLAGQGKMEQGVAAYGIKE